MSPRGAQHVMLAAQAEALLNGRDFVMPEDVIAVSGVVLNHRVVLSADARMDNLTADDVVQRLVKEVRIPAGLA